MVISLNKNLYYINEPEVDKTPSMEEWHAIQRNKIWLNDRNKQAWTRRVSLYPRYGKSLECMGKS